MARYYSYDDLIEHKKDTCCDMYDLEEFLENVPTADVVERGPFAKRLLLDLKAAVTNKATYPDFNADYAYVNLKVFNALVQEFIKKYEEGKDEG